LSYINRNRARQTGTNRTTQAEISNGFWLSFPGRVNYERTPVSTGRVFRGQVNVMHAVMNRIKDDKVISLGKDL
jgi:hypothetical protein